MDRNMRKRLGKALGLLALLAAAFLFVVLVWKPSCLFTELTGLSCPGCGSQRMIWSVLRGDLPGAFRQNPLLFCVLPLAAGYIVWEVVRYVKGKPPFYQRRAFLGAACVLLAAAVAFSVLRNLPGFEWLGPF